MTLVRNKPIEILLVEDNDDDVVFIREAFADANLLNLLNGVKDGVEAMAYLRREGEYEDRNLPGLVLLDINMPRKNGFEVLEEMKADPLLRQVPVIMLTCSKREEDVVRSYDGGVSTFITKPVSFDAFQEMVRRFSLYWTLVARIPRTPA